MVMRGLDQMPRRGDKPEWSHSQDYWAEKDSIPRTDLTADPVSEGLFLLENDDRLAALGKVLA